MPSTHTSLHYHLVWSTKDRRNWIDVGWRDRLHTWLGGAIRGQGGQPVAIGGMGDHVHCLAGLKPTHCLADLVRMIKSESSEWAHRELKIPLFQWQEGYGAFTVGPNSLAAVAKYVRNQEEHHRVKTFQEEYLELLKKSGIEYDEKHLW